MNCPDSKCRLGFRNRICAASAKRMASSWQRRWEARAKYVVFVGSLTVPLHNPWADVAIAYIQKNYPDMTMIGDRYGVAEDADNSRNTAVDVIAANPDLEGLPRFWQPGSDRRRPRQSQEASSWRDIRLGTVLARPRPKTCHEEGL